MTTNTRFANRARVGLRALVAAALVCPVLAAAGCAGRPAQLADFPTDPADPSIATQQIVLRFDNDERATAALNDSPAAREFAARLPLTLDLFDAMGQARVAPLTEPLTSTGGRVNEPDVGGIYWAPADEMIALYYDDLGQRVPAPGLVPLGNTRNPDGVEHGRGRVRIELAAPAQP